MRLGTNLIEVGYSSTEGAFLNLMKSAEGWSPTLGTGNSTGEEAAFYANFVDANRYPTTLDGPDNGYNFTACRTAILPNQGAESGGSISNFLYPPGVSVILYDGIGTFYVDQDAAIVDDSVSGRILVNVTTPTSQGWRLFLTATGSGANYCKNIRVVYSPDSRSVAYGGSIIIGAREALLNSGQIFDPNFIAGIQEYNTIRFMKWMQTIYNDTVNWSDRSQLGWCFWSETPFIAPALHNSGVPYEVQFALCNEINAHWWGNIPYLATDAYVTSLAQLAAAILNANLECIPESGNEAFNWTAITPFSIMNAMSADYYAIFPGLSADISTVTFSGSTLTWTTGTNPFDASHPDSATAGFRTNGVLPAPIASDAPGTLYYVVTVSGSTYQVSETPGGSPITFSGGSGTLTGFAASYNTVALGWNCYRSVAVGNNFQQTFQAAGRDPTKVIRIVCSIPNDIGGITSALTLNQLSTANGGPSSLPYWPTGTTVAQNVDALGTAPYFPSSSGTYSDSLTVDQMIQQIKVGGVLPGGYSGGELQFIVDTATNDYNLCQAQSPKLRYFNYEGGQQYTTSDATLQAIFAAMNRDPRMFDVYTEFLNKLKNVGVELMCNFTLIAYYTIAGGGDFFGNRESGYAPLHSPREDACKMFINPNRRGMNVRGGF